jgi:hypothetical protein
MNTRNTGTRSARNSRFQRGSGVFTCGVCGRSTRDTGHGVSDICEQDYEIAGLDNQANDDGIKPNTKEWKVFVKDWCGNVNGYLDKIAKLGGNVQHTINANENLFADGHGFKVPVTLTASTVANVAKDMERALNKPAVDATMSGTIFTRKAKGRKLQFIMGGPTLADAPNMVRALPNFVYEWHSHDGSVKTEFTPKGVAAHIQRGTLNVKELVKRLESYGESLQVHVSVEGGADYMQLLNVEYHDGALWIVVAPEDAS